VDAITEVFNILNALSGLEGETLPGFLVNFFGVIFMLIEAIFNLF